MELDLSQLEKTIKYQSLEEATKELEEKLFKLQEEDLPFTLIN
jgi:hypothetical protein